MLKQSNAPIWVTGHQGMLGSRVVTALKARGWRVCTNPNRLRDTRDVMSFAYHYRPAGIINCAGVIPNKGLPSATDAVRTNAELPHALAQVGVPMVHMSTDCVYSGQQEGLYVDKAHPDPIDLYGRSKLAGEPIMPNVVVVRGSFIGPEHGFLRWLLDAKGGVDAWVNAMWSGTTADAMAQALAAILTGDLVPPEPVVGTNVIHVATAEPVPKSYLVNYFIMVLGLELAVANLLTPVINRAMVPDITLPSLDMALAAMVAQILRNAPVLT